MIIFNTEKEEGKVLWYMDSFIKKINNDQKNYYL